VILVAMGRRRGIKGGSERGGCALTEVIVPLAHVVVRPEDVDDLGWQERALCAQTDPEAFFPEKGGSTREAKRVCRSCEVRAECLEYALENDERFGIWGGLSERERRRIKRQVV
jgi:WhiB family transcriptional regulator, redox-sensing transcriptional regulator